MRPSNPYIAGNPVRGQEKFIGRADVLRDVERTLRHPDENAIVLFGQRRIGKTSVLLNVERELAAKQEYTPIYFDLQDKAALPLADVLYQMAQKIAFVTKTPLPEREKFDAKGTFFRETFIPTAGQTCQNQGLVLLLDEFDVLDLPKQEQAVATFFPYLRDWMSTAKGIQFVFFLGCRPEELSTETLAAFKAIRSRRVSLMTRDDTETIIRQSEQNGSLAWSDEAIERVWYWTQGHPYFTQLLCSEIWEQRVENSPPNPLSSQKRGGVEDEHSPSLLAQQKGSVADERSPSLLAQQKRGGQGVSFLLPSVTPEHVDAAIDRTLEQGAHAFQWIWNGLPPAERIVMAAMAEAKTEQITPEELAETLNQSKVRLILRDLELAPETLVQWDLLRPMDNGFRFAIPLLRRWVNAEKPLRRVKADLDSVEPLAENLFRSGEGFSKIGNLAEAEQHLRRALNVNPNHFKARLLLGEVLLAQGNPTKAVTELEPAYQFDPRSAQADFIRALLAFAATQNPAEQWTTYERILALTPNQPDALEGKRAILRKQAKEAVKMDDLQAALKLYQELGDQQAVTEIQTTLRKRELAQHIALAQQHEQDENWSEAIAIYEKLLQEFPAEEDWQARLKATQMQQKLTDAYTKALTALEKKNPKLAQKHLGKILSVQPDYKDAALYLLLALKGTDVDALAQHLRQVVARLEAIQCPPVIVKPEPVIIEPEKPQIVIPDVVKTQCQPFEFDVITVNERGEEIKKERGQAYQYVEDLGGGVTLEMAYIPGGTFQMGSPETEEGRDESESPHHEVMVMPFYMGKYPVTQEQWEVMMENNPSNFKGVKRPVETVSWDDAVEFCKRLSESTDKTYRLPSEAEWEYACRARTTTPFYFGVTITPELANYDNKYNGTTEVGKFPPNAFGLYNMHGNVWEWCADPWHYKYEGAPSDSRVWKGGESHRVIRGGGWVNVAPFVRCAFRDYTALDSRDTDIGFRLARTI